MIKDFIKQTIELIESSDINIRQTEIRPVVFENINGDYHSIVHIQAFSRYSGSKLSNNYILQITIMFTLLDALIDNKYPQLQGKTFSCKYRSLKGNDDDEIILKQVFRIFKLLRNASVHSMGAIKYEKDAITVSYVYHKTSYNMHITTYGLTLLFTYIMDIIKPLNHLTKKHHICLKRELYDEIKKEITTFNDEFGSKLPNISNKKRLRRGLRYFVKNPDFKVVNNHIKIVSIYELDADTDAWRGVDYSIEYGSNQYMIPSETLINGKIPIVDLLNWKLN